MNEMLFLGAGASVEAGVPDAIGMTRSMLGSFQNPFSTKEAHVVSFVIGGLLYQKGVRGEDPLSGGVNVEELFNALHLLAERNTLEAATFVGSWHPLVQEFDRETASRVNLDELERVMFQNREESSHDFEHAFRKAVEAPRERSGSGKIYRDILFAMTIALRDLVWIDSMERVAYLKPISHLLERQKRLVVATANYDNSIELMAESAGVQCATGINEWWVDGALDFAGEGLQLLKVHGSIDWQMVPDYTDDTHPMPRSVFRRIRGAEMRAAERIFRPALIFGQRNKLTVEGPFLELLRAFQVELAKTDRLTVVGYSFRDTHINECISQWLNKRPEHMLRVVDPGFCERPSNYARQLMSFCASRIEIIAENAGMALQRLYPPATPDGTEPKPMQPDQA